MMGRHKPGMYFCDSGLISITVFFTGKRWAVKRKKQYQRTRPTNTKKGLKQKACALPEKDPSESFLNSRWIQGGLGWRHSCLSPPRVSGQESQWL